MPAPSLEEISKAKTPGRAPSLEEIAQANSGANPNDPNLLRSAVQIGFAGTRRLAANLASGAVAGLSEVDKTGANLFLVADGASRWLSEQTGLSHGGAFSRIESYLRRDSEALMQKAQALSPGQTTADKATQILGSLVPEASQALSAVAVGGPVAGFGLLGALRGADQGVKVAAIEAAKGLVLGSIFKATELGPGRIARATAVGAGAGALEAASGAPHQDVALSAVATGFLAGITARPARRYNGIAPEAIPEPEAASKPRLRTTGVLSESAPAGEAAKVHPAVVVTPRTSQVSVEFLGRDYSDVIPPDRVMNLNLTRIEGPNDLKAATADFVEAFRPQIDQARRGVISHQQTARLAEDLGLSVEQLMARRKGQALNAEEAVAYRQMNRSALEQWHGLAKKIQSGKANDIEKADFLKSTAVTESIIEQTLGATAEAGRALSSFNMRVGPSTAQMKQLRHLLEDFRGGEGKVALERFAEQVAMIDTPEGLARFAKDWRKATTGDKLIEGWINGLLSGPQTHVVNIFSNLMTAFSTVPRTLGAASFDIGRTGPDKVYFREALARTYGLLEGTADGLRLAGKVLRTEQAAGPHELFGPATTIEGRPGAIGGWLGKGIRTPGRLLMAEDAFFQAIAFRQELRAQAVRKALGEGRRGADLETRVSKLVDNPSEEQLGVAYDHARRQTFTEDLGDMGRAVQRFSLSHPMARLLLPFVRTPTNIFKYAARSTPLGLAMKEIQGDIRKGGAARSTAIAQMSMGSMAMAWAASLAQQDRMTGSGPADEELRRVWLLDHQPFSIKVGDSWVSYARVEPMSTILGLAADYADISGHIDEATGQELTAAMALSFKRNIQNKTFLQGISAASEAMNDPLRFGDRFVQQLAGTLVPAGVAQYARSEDPVLRDTRGLVDRIRSRIHGFSADLPPIRNVWGEPVLLAGGVGSAFMSPFYRKPRGEDTATGEAIRLRAQLTQPDPNQKLRGLDLSPQEFSELAKTTGQTAKLLIDRLVSSPIYRNIPDGMKKSIMEDLYADARKMARDQAFIRIAKGDPVRLRAAVEESLVKKIGPLVGMGGTAEAQP